MQIYFGILQTNPEKLERDDFYFARGEIQRTRNRNLNFKSILNDFPLPLCLKSSLVNGASAISALKTRISSP